MFYLCTKFQIIIPLLNYYNWRKLVIISHQDWHFCASGSTQCACHTLRTEYEKWWVIFKILNPKLFLKEDTFIVLISNNKEIAYFNRYLYIFLFRFFRQVKLFKKTFQIVGAQLLDSYGGKHSGIWTCWHKILLFCCFCANINMDPTSWFESTNYLTISLIL